MSVKPRPMLKELPFGDVMRSRSGHLRRALFHLLHLVIRRLGGTGTEAGDFDQLLFQFSRGLRRAHLSNQNRMHRIGVSLRNRLIGGPGLDGRPGDNDACSCSMIPEDARVRNRRRIGEFNLDRAAGAAALFSRIDQAAQLEAEKRNRFLTMSRM